MKEVKISGSGESSSVSRRMSEREARDNDNFMI